MLKSLDEVKMTESSAHSWTFACFSILFASLQRIKNGIGPMMYSCGTPVYKGMAFSFKLSVYHILVKSYSSTRNKHILIEER